MPVDPYELPAVRRSIRKLLDWPDGEAVDLVFLAGILANFNPNRAIPIWLVILAPPASGKTELIRLLDGWEPAHRLPNAFSTGYFLSSKSGQDSILLRLQRQKKRIFTMPDMIGLTRMAWKDGAMSIYAQLVDIHDGAFKRGTGFSDRELIYDAKDNERFGWIGAGTPDDFHRFQTTVSLLGSRFLTYYLDSGDHWSSYEKLATMTANASGKTLAQVQARNQVQRFLDHVISSIGDHADTKMSEKQIKRLAAAVRLTQRAIGGNQPDKDTGRRLMLRAAEIVKMCAFMSGRGVVDESDIQVGMRVIVSQLPTTTHKALAFAAHKGEFEIRELLLATGTTRRVYQRALNDLVELGILNGNQKGKRRGNLIDPARYSLSSDSKRLLHVADPDRVFFHAPEPVALEE